MDTDLAVAQTLRYAEGVRDLYVGERRQRRLAEDANARLEDAYGDTVRALAAALELRDDSTGAHATRVTQLALEIARVAAPELAREKELEYGFLLHDLGKIGIPDAILLKPGPLTPAELAEMRRHPLIGTALLDSVPHLGALARAVVLSHHERWAGGGYPHGLSGADIPLAARIFAIADAWDAMTNDRPYRAALDPARALMEIESGAGGQFDPALVRIFAGLAPEILKQAA